MVKARKVSVSKFTAAIALTCLIFIGGILIGISITKSKTDDIANMKQQLELELSQLDLEDKIISDNCIDPKLLVEKLDDLSARLTYLEAQYAKNDPKIIELKEPYTLLEIRHYLRMKQMNEICDSNYTLILFFYSNDPENKDNSEKQGFVLDYLRSKYENVKIYSFDSDLNMSIIQTLKEANQITITPSTVIDGKVYAGFHDKDELTSVIEKSQ